MATANVVAWDSDNNLTWSDFEADANPAEFEDAYSAIRYRPTWVVVSEQRTDCSMTGDARRAEGSAHAPILFSIRDLEIHTEFHAALSWARTGCGNEHLQHQQGHFDLAELVMRESIQDLREMLYENTYDTRGKNEDQRKQFAKEDSARTIEPLVKDLYDKMITRQAKYDADTKHGEDAQAQASYDKMFESL